MGAIHRVVPAPHPGQVFWFHGNSGGGKTRLALEFNVPNKIVLDADDLRDVWTDLEFDIDSRWTQNLRLARLARLLMIQGYNVCVASICPYAELRELIKATILPSLTWVYVVGPDTKPTSDEYPFEEGGWGNE